MQDHITTAADFTRLLEAEVQRRLGDEHLTLGRYATLARADQTTVVELAQRAGVTAQLVSKTVRDLRLLGYVDAVGVEDRRRRLLQITERGRDALARASDLSLPATLLAAMQAYVASHPNRSA